MTIAEVSHRADRARVAEALQESEGRYRLLAENSSDVIIRTSSDGAVGYVSPSCRSVLGYETEEMVGHADSRGIHPDDLTVVRGALASMTASEKIATCEFRARRKDGSYVWVEAKTRRLSSPLSGRTDEFQSAVRDISERKHAEAETKRAQQEAELANRAKSGFLSSMSHELRTPLNAVLGFTGTLLMGLHGPLADEQVTQLRTVEHAGRHLLYLIDSLLELARIESEKVDLELELADCQGLVDEVAAELRPLASEKGLELEVVPASEPIELLCDRRAVIRILVNLTDNAIRFTDEGSVRLELERQFVEDRCVTRFTVIDTGRGIEPEAEEKLSAAFAASATADERLLDGSGLGLYLSQSLARVVDGKITFANVPGAGSTFALEMTGSAS
jgi:PAS domain S-box-containing protein